MRCPDCESDLIRVSTKRGLVDLLVSILGMRPYRCEVCRKRFYQMTGMLSQRYDPNRPAAAAPARPGAKTERQRRSRRHWTERFARWRRRSGERLMRQVIVLAVIGVGLAIFFLLISRDWGGNTP